MLAHDRCRDLGAKILEQADIEARKTVRLKANENISTGEYAFAFGVAAELVAIGKLIEAADYFNTWRASAGFQAQAITFTAARRGIMVAEQREGGFMLLTIDYLRPGQSSVESAFVSNDDALTISWLAVLAAGHKTLDPRKRRSTKGLLDLIIRGATRDLKQTKTCSGEC